MASPWCSTGKDTSPIFLAAMKKKRIACLTYHKHPGEDWPRQEFFAPPVRLASGQETTMQLAKQGTRLSQISCGCAESAS